VWTAGQRVLCVADGEGRNSVWLVEGSGHHGRSALIGVVARRR